MCARAEEKSRGSSYLYERKNERKREKNERKREKKNERKHASRERAVPMLVHVDKTKPAYLFLYSIQSAK